MIEFIAEIGSNHNQNYHRAVNLIDAAKEAQFNAVKFQLYTKDLLYAKGYAPEDLIEFPMEWIPDLYKYCLKKEIDIGYSIFHKAFIEKCKPYCHFLKISSWDVMRIPLIKACVDTNLPLMISLGGISLPELKNIVDIIPIHANVTLFHCIPKYPCDPKECNLQIIKQLGKLTEYTTGYDDKESTIYRLRVGWSDHSHNYEVIKTAVCMGAKVIEMHFDLHDMKGNESHHGHVWSNIQALNVIHSVKEINEIKGIKLLKDNEKLFKKERLQRASLLDGLRPLEIARNK